MCVRALSEFDASAANSCSVCAAGFELDTHTQARAHENELAIEKRELSSASAHKVRWPHARLSSA